MQAVGEKLRIYESGLVKNLYLPVCFHTEVV